MYNQLNDSNKVNVLFICLGNIYRPPTAHAVMQHLVEERGCADRYMIDSAGVDNWHIGQLPDKRMREHGRQRGYSVDHRARQFNACKDFELFDKTVVMNEDNYRNIMSQAPNEAARERAVRIADFFTQRPSATCVPDPYYGDAEDFSLALDLVEDGCEGILNTT